MHAVVKLIGMPHKTKRAAERSARLESKKHRGPYYIVARVISKKGK